MDELLSRAVIAYVGWDTDVALPGRYPERVADGLLKDRVLEIIALVDAEELGSQSLWEWGREIGGKVSSRFPQLSEDAVVALVALITLDWR